VRSSTAAKASIGLYDTDGNTTTSTAGTGWEWLEVTRTIADDTATFYADLSSQRHSSGTYISYFSQPMLVFGSSIGEGNYTRPQGEIVDCEKSDQYLNSFATSAFSSGSGTPSLEAESNGQVPKGAKAVYLNVGIRDSDSASGGICRMFLGNDSTSKYQLTLRNDGVVDDMFQYNAGRVSLDANGDFYYDIDATGSNTLDTRIWVTAVELR
jgi:hypothetical protein